MSTSGRKLKWQFEECAAQRRLSEAEADMDIRNWEPRNSDRGFV